MIALARIRWAAIIVVAIAVLLILLAWLFNVNILMELSITSETSDTAAGEPILAWMAWTWQGAAFFGVIGALLVGMTIWEILRPGGNPRRGILGLRTTRGDRLFISLLSAAYIHLAWLGLITAPLWGALLISVALALVIFRWV